MPEYDLLRGKVTAHLGDREKGLVEVALGGYDKDLDKLHARVEQTVGGLYWLPELGDVVEVSVPRTPGYEAHVLRVHRPEGNEQAAACWTDKNDRKQIQTRSGHTITLDDTQDQTSITVQSAGGLQIKLEDKGKTVTVKGTDGDTPSLTLDMKNGAIRLAAGKGFAVHCGGAAIEIDSSGNVRIQAKGKLELSGQEILLSARNKLTAKGQQAELSGGMTTKVTGQTKLHLSSSGITQVDGNLIKLN